MKKMILCAAVALSACLFTAVPARAVTTFVLGDQPGEVTGDSMQVRVTISELAGSLGLKDSLNVKLDVVSPYVGDLLGAFFHVSDETLLSSLVVTGADVTEVKIDANNVIKVGGGNVMNGAVSSGFDVGLRIGSQGIGQGDDYATTTFNVRSTTDDLTEALFTSQIFGVRVQSVGLNRDGSSKLVGTVPNPDDDVIVHGPPVPEPATAAMGLISLAGLAMASRRRRRS